MAIKANRSRERGFTLIELLIVISLVGIGASVSVHSFRGFRDTHEARAGVTELLNVIQFAKGKASATNQVIVLDFAPSGLTPQAGFVEVFLDSNTDAVSDPGEDILAALPNAESYGGKLGLLLGDLIAFSGVSTGVGPLGQSTAGDGVPFSGNQLSVLPDGTLSEAGVITLVDRYGQTYGITASVGGGVRVWTFDGTTWR
jgi:prepilin-type N-terminal cleavage/methylation domain-containing protein